MNTRIDTHSTFRTLGRTLCVAGAVAALAALGLGSLAGCDDSVSQEFRAAAMGSIESGVKTIADGILTGVFTVADPTQNSNSTTNGGTTGG
jgi:hypothetical protein